MTERLSRLADRGTYLLGSPWSIVAAVILVPLWLLLAPSVMPDSWSRLMDAMTIITFLVVFVIQASTNRGHKALMLKVDELLLHAAPPEADEAIGAEELPEDQLDEMRAQVQQTRDQGA